MAGAAAAHAQATQTEAAQTEPAQAEPPSPESGGLQEVIVTATRRVERLQEVPESITAFDTNAIAIRGLQQMEDYARMVPGLSLGTREPGATTIVFRGVAASGLSFGSVSSSGLYLDEQPITQSGRNPDPRLIDIERVEALRGPQGTLYGSSSQSGTLRVITNKPDAGGFDAWTEAQGSTTHQGGTGHDVSAMINVPLVADKLAFRLVGFTAEDAGFIDNVFSESLGVNTIPGQPATYTNADVVGEDVNTAETNGGRAALRWDVSETFNATLGAIFQDVSADGHGDINVTARGNQGTTLDVGDLKQVRFSDENLDDKWYQLGLTLNSQLPFGDAVISASYFDREFRYEADATAYEFGFNQNFIAYGGYYIIYDFGGNPRGFATNHERTHITTLEARLASKGDTTSRWGWLVGAFYSHESGKTDFNSFINNYPSTGSFQYFNGLETYYYSGNPLAPTDKWFVGLYDTLLDQVAAFGEVSFDFTEHFTITAGGRWFDYDRKNAQIQNQPEGFTGFTLLNDSQQTSESGTVSKLNLTYKFDRDRLVYATYSEGFRVGGSNQLKPATILPRSYESDDLQNFEVGAKTEWLDNRLRLNLSAYYMKWNDFAVQIEDPQNAVFALGFINLPTAEIPGVEGDFAVTLSDEWQLDGSFSWNDATTEGATIDVGRGALVFPFTVEDGSRLPLTPDWSAALGLEFRAKGLLLNAKPYARFDYSYTGTSFNSLAGIESVVANREPVKQDSYQIGDLRFGLEGDHWNGSIFVDNLWDERANLFVSNRWNFPRQSVNRPRSIGIQVRYNF